MKKNSRRVLWFIIILTLVSFAVILPDGLRLRLKSGPIDIDRKVESPKIDLNFFSLKIKKEFNTKLGLDLSGGTHVVLEADLTGIPEVDRESAFESAKNTVERRVNLYGLTEPVIQSSKVGESYRIIVEIPGISNASDAIELVGRTAQLGFFEEASQSAETATPSSFLDVWPIKTELTGKNLKRSEVAFDPNTGKPQVALEFDAEGASLFEKITQDNVGKTVAIVLDEEVVSAPRVNEPITGGRAVISGDFSLDEAKRLSISLNSGALPVPLNVISQRQIGATLGQESIEKSLMAGLIGLGIIAIFMIYSYGWWGFIADVALIIYSILVFAIFKTVPVTLTLAGIAGFILSIGMAVDANILIFERIKEEIKWGSDSRNAISLGFDRAFPSIRDSNISSLITCVILYYFGTGIVRGFAVTLSIGILISLFSAITVTRTLLKLIYE